MSIKRTATVGLLVVGGIVGFAGSASAVTKPTRPGSSTATTVAGTTDPNAAVTKSAPNLDTAKAACTATITERTAELDRLTARVSGAKNLTSAHAASLGALITTAKTGLAGLATTITGDSDGPTLKADCQKVFTDYRVFALVSPQVHLTITADNEAAVITRLTTVSTKLADAITKHSATAKDPAGATAAQADMVSQLTAATTALTGVVDQLLVITPAQWNANHAVMQPVTSAIRTAHQDVKKASADAKTVIADLKAK
jgi:hypothetical protein